jgi:deoxyribose-phosphate aldolase
MEVVTMKPQKKATEMSVAELAKYIDQSVLKPEFTQDDIRKYIQEGIDFGCKTVCINPASLNIAAELTKDTDTKICVVCDFPFGLSTTNSKVMQAEEYCKRGDIFELDIVANYGWIRSGMWKEVEEDIKAVCDVCHRYGTAVKVIFETDTLTIEQVKKATEVAVAAGADFVKTSTGFFVGSKNEGATVEVIQAMMDVAQGRCKVKGSGGIRDQAHFFTLIDMGIDRMGIGYKSTPIVLGVTIADLNNKEIY